MISTESNTKKADIFSFVLPSIVPEGAIIRDLQERTRKMFDFNTLISKVKSAASAAGQKTGELYEFSKLKMRVISLRNQLGKEYKKLGKAVWLQATGADKYEIYIQGRIDVISAIVDELDRISDIMNNAPKDSYDSREDAEEEIRRIRAEIAQIKGEIENINE